MPKFDFRSQKIVVQLNNFYEIYEGANVEYKISKYSVSKAFKYDEIYNLLDEEKKINYPPDVKQELWLLAQQALTLNNDNPKYINDYYKSFLAIRYLIDRMPERMSVYDEQGKRITRIELTIK